MELGNGTSTFRREVGFKTAVYIGRLLKYSATFTIYCAFFTGRLVIIFRVCFFN